MKVTNRILNRDKGADTTIQFAYGELWQNIYRYNNVLEKIKWGGEISRFRPLRSVSLEKNK